MNPCKGGLWAAGQDSQRTVSMVTSGRKGCVLTPSQDRKFVPRLSKTLWGGLLPKLAPDSVFLASLKHGILSFGSWWQAACHLWFWCHVQGNALCHRAWKDTVGRAKLPGAEAEVPQQGEGSRSGHRTVVSLSLLPLFQSRLGGLDGAHIWLAALWGHFKVLLQVLYWRSDAGLDQWQSRLWVFTVGWASQNLKPCFWCLSIWLKYCNSYGINSCRVI